ncbi:MAG: trehalose-phosphatase [Nitrospirae bacterium]|nr:trehalose-phosphatase [Nitrospirota bacterium]
MKKGDKSRYLFEKAGSDRFFPAGRTPRKVALFIDFDGTLVPIQEDPSRCFLPESVKAQLRVLSAAPRCSVSVISGRSLRDIRVRVGIRALYYAGNHGLDISGPHLRYTHQEAMRARPILRRIKRRLEEALAVTEGVRLEDKKLTLSLHFRSAKKEDIPRVKQVFYATADTFLKEGSLGLIKGKKVLELTPGPSWNKGSAVDLILRRLGKDCFPVYIGDDSTDETAFAVLRQKGLALRVGKSNSTAAHFFLKGRREVPRVLTLIIRKLGAA